jgi:hypothetical protein
MNGKENKQKDLHKQFKTMKMKIHFYAKTVTNKSGDTGKKLYSLNGQCRIQCTYMYVHIFI